MARPKTPMTPYRNRRSIRLQGYDYHEDGGYFVTICTAERSTILAEIRDDHVILSALGQAAEAAWNAIPTHFPSVMLDVYVIMPNHLHGILLIQQAKTDIRQSALGTIVNQYKAAVTREARKQYGDTFKVWQRNYFERVIRGEKELNAIREYIIQNPGRWQEDEDNLH